MNKKILVISIIFLFSISIVTAYSTNCPDRGKLELNLEKTSYQQGERITGDLIIDNYNVQSSLGKIRMGLHKGIDMPWEISTSIKKINYGRTVSPIYQFIKSYPAIPTNAEISKDWYLEIVLNMDGCIFYETKQIEVYSCFDGLLNGDEKGIDCGGSCISDCAKSIQFPGQLIYRKAYYRNIDDYSWKETKINKLPFAKTFQNDLWIDGSKVSVNMPKQTYMLTAYGCCCKTCDETNFLFNCDYVKDTRYKIEDYGNWECGWTIK